MTMELRYVWVASSDQAGIERHITPGNRHDVRYVDEDSYENQYQHRATASQDLDIATEASSEHLRCEVTTAVDVSAYVERKIAAIAAHRTQYPIDPTLLPIEMLQEMMGREYFVRVAPARELETELLIRSESTPVIKLDDLRRMRAVA
jgi:LmbE family N-acetylglucosaminyl deacetylase